VYKTFQKVVAPFKPIVDAIQAPLPGVSDVSRLVGGGDISILTLMKLYGTFSQDGGEQTQALERIIRLLSTLVQLAGDGTVKLGDFGIVPDKALAGVPTPDQIQNFITGNLLNGVNDVIDKIHEKCAECADAINQLEQQVGLNELTDKSIGLHFPVLDNPGSLANLLLGADVPLVTYDTGPLHNHFDFAVTIGPLGLPIFIDIGVAATIDARFKAGFDTYGMRKALQGGGVASILDGLYLQDFDDQGHEKPEITIKDAMTYIDAKVSVVAAEAGIRGDITLSANLDLRDTDSPEQPNVPNTGTGDGKVRFSEIARDAQGNFNPFCLFNAKGDISARLVLFFRIKFIVEEEWDDVLAQSKILDIDYDCSQPRKDPVLAHESGSDLIIHVGKNGTDALRGDSYWGNEPGGDVTKPPFPPVPGGETQPTEITTVRALHDKDGNFRGFGVDLLGYHKDFLNPSLTRVVIDATDYDGEEVVNLMGDGSGTAKNATSRVDHFDKQAVFYGGKHNDQFKADSVAGQQIAADGGPGNDLVVTGYGNDLVAGGGGQDNISTAGGNDKVEGDGKIFGGLAPTMDPTGLFANTPDPNDGNDNIDAGIGADTVNGGGGDDFIAGGVDDGRAPTDPNNAALRDDNNVLIGGCGNDHINGGPHHDEIYGEAFSNALANGTATGDIAGCTAEADHIDSGTGNDLIFGGGGADDIRAHSTPDDNSSNPKADVVYGNGGNDNITTGSGDDTISGGPDIDNIFGGTGADLIHGDAGNDNLRGDTLSSGKKLLRSTVKLPSTVIDGNDEMYGDAGNDTMFGGGGNDLMFGDSGNSKCPAPTSTNPTVWPAPTEVSIATDGEDDIGGGPGDDIISGEGAKDTITGDTGNDRVCGHAGDDTVSGNGGTDLLSGGSGGDTMYGDENNDHVEGNNGVDTMSGGPGIDQLIGGTSVAASNDNGDTIYGDADADTIIGDNGTISDSTPPVVNVFDLTSGNSAYGGGDTIDGGYGNDLAFGGLDGDTVRGGNDDDHLEGNVGLDNVYGGPDQDDILGGTSPVALGGADPTSIPDVGDNIFGEGGSDVALGDNGVIARDNPPVLDGSDPSDVPMVHRVVTMLGVYTGGPIVGGNDNMNGGDNDDWMFGQAGNDTLNGDANSDHLEGNNATDTVNGGDGDDDIFGGTSPMALAAGKTTTDVSDNGDTLNGDAGADYMLGDNGNLVHPLDSGKWARAQADNSFLRTPTLLDRLTIGGGDTMSGGADNDRMWGEVGNDTMSGNGGDDYMEGNIASDVMAGGSNDDDIIGGTSPVALPAGADAAVEDDGVVSAGKRTGNHICGFECGQTTSNGDNDVIAGNNARVDRCAPLAGAVPRGRDNCAWTQTSYGNAEPGSPSLGTAATRYVTLLGESSTETNRDADDYVEGNSGNDDAYGQDGNDVEHGDTPAATSPRVVSGWASVTAPSPDECLPVSDATAGQDRLLGGYGNDLGCGDGGNDALLGDRATVGLVPFSGALRTIDSAGPPNMTSTFPNSGHTIYPVTLIDPTVGGNDLLFGGPDNDSMHGGAGDDFMQGDDGIRIGGQVAATGSDILFGDNGNDSMEGGPGNDDSWGGYGNDDIDVWRDTSGSAPKVNEDNKSLDYLFMNIPAYAARFPAPAGKSYDKDVGVTNDPTTANGDHGYGGFNRDILQADTLNDRLDDSFGSYNLFFVCPAAYGGSQITRALSPGIVTYFQDLGEAEGATGAATPSSSGGGEVSIVYPGTANPDNAGAAYKTTPGHFTCIP
jgi:Ca2+-binding RTX toxin-like protein